jgi:uncharacterized protein (UPF0261 family)
MSLNRVIAVTLNSVTEAGAIAAVEFFRRSGWRSQIFDLQDGGGLAFEEFVLHRQAAGVLDYALADLADMRLSGRENPGPNRLTAASSIGLPQVLVPGGLDHATFDEAPPDSLADHRHHQPDDFSFLVRTSAEDNDAFGREIAYKSSVSTGKVTIVFPRGGFSQWDAPELPFHDPLATQTLLDSLYLWKIPQVKIVESHRHINDPHFADIAAENLLKIMVERSS